MKYLHLSAQFVSISIPGAVLGIVSGPCTQELGIWITPVWGFQTDKSKNVESGYLIVFGRPPVESHFECFNDVILLYDETHSPIPLVVLGVNEIAYVVQLAYGWLFSLICHFKISVPFWILYKNYTSFYKSLSNSYQSLNSYFLIYICRKNIV